MSQICGSPPVCLLALCGSLSLRSSLGPASVCFGCGTERHRLGGLPAVVISFSALCGLAGRHQGASRGHLARARFLLADRWLPSPLVLPWCREPGSVGPFPKGRIPPGSLQLCDLTSSQRPCLLKPSHWGLGFNTGIGGDADVQFIAPFFPPSRSPFLPFLPSSCFFKIFIFNLSCIMFPAHRVPNLPSCGISVSSKSPASLWCGNVMRLQKQGT